MKEWLEPALTAFDNHFLPEYIRVRKKEVKKKKIWTKVFSIFELSSLGWIPRNGITSSKGRTSGKMNLLRRSKRLEMEECFSILLWHFPTQRVVRGTSLSKVKRRWLTRTIQRTCTPSTHRKPKGVGLVAPAGNG